MSQVTILPNGTIRRLNRRLGAYDQRLNDEAAAALRLALEQSGKSQKDFANELGNSVQWLNTVLTGRRNITLGTLSHLGRALGVTFEIHPMPLSSPVAYSARFHRTAKVHGHIRRKGVRPQIGDAEVAIIKATDLSVRGSKMALARQFGVKPSIITRWVQRIERGHA